MKKILCALAILCPLSSVAASSDWQSIFNGQNLDGWTPKFAGYPLGVNFNNTFRVENGLIKVSYDQYDQFKGEFGHLFYKAPLSNYRLRLEYRFTGEQSKGGPIWAFRNNGVMLHAQEPASMTKDQVFPVSIELQFLGQTGEGVRPTGNLCTPGTHVVMNAKLITEHCIYSSSPTFVGDGWVSVEVEVRDSGDINHIVNGVSVLKYTDPQFDPDDQDVKQLLSEEAGLSLTGGYIALQAESHPTEFRNIEIQCLDDKPCFETLNPD